MKKLHLFCNSHIDVIWQWKIEEAIATTLSTFRVAAELCEKYDDFVFNHNEAILYQWVEKYEPALFERIQTLVKEGKWHIVGGWMLQPDCLMPSGEALVRQILYGRKYFKEKFGVEPETAMNVDSFGHAQGMVQVLWQCGYKHYIYMRPESIRMENVPQLFEWRGYDDESKIAAYKLNTGYATLLGQAADTIQEYIQDNQDTEIAMRCWGIGNHGGGPSRQDVEAINVLMKQYRNEVEIVHSTPDDFLKERLEKEKALPVIAEDLIPSWVGCYSTLVEIKQLYRTLENMLISAEKIAAACEMQLGEAYPEELLREAFHSLMILQFHDVLPGTCSRPAAEQVIRYGHHALALAEGIHTDAMFRLTAKESAAANGEIPVFVWNPHPYEIEDIVECEFMLADQNWEDSLTMVHAYVEGKEVPCQNIKEDSNFNLDWRKRVAIKSRFAPMSITRIELKPYTVEPPVFDIGDKGVYTFDNGEMRVEINRFTGLMDSYRVNNVEYLQPGAFQLEVFYDSADPWRIDTNRIDQKKGEYILLSSDAAAKFAGVQKKNFQSVRVVEDGAVFVRVEALFGYGESKARILYTLPKKGTDFSVDITSLFAEKDTCLRLSVPLSMQQPGFRGQSIFGNKPLFADGKESEAQCWIAADDGNKAFIMINNGTYGSSNLDNQIRQTLLRSSAYAGHPIPERPFMEYNRYLPRAEQGERNFHFRVLGTSKQTMVSQAEHFAAIENEKLLAYNIFPKGEGGNTNALIELSEPKIRLTAYKKAEDGDGYIIRLFNPEDRMLTTQIQMPVWKLNKTVTLKHHQIQTYRVDKKGICEGNILD